jgi:Protein of unknown function (DUF1360)
MRKMNTLLRLVVAALATWRLSFLLARESGPWQVFARLRSKRSHGFLGELLSCVKCSGFWIAPPFALFVTTGRLERLVTWIALAGATALIDELTKPPFELRELGHDELLQAKSDSAHD